MGMRHVHEAWQELLEAEDDEEVCAKLENTEGAELLTD